MRASRLLSALFVGAALLLTGCATSSPSLAQSSEADGAQASDDNPNEVFDPALFDELGFRSLGPHRGGRVTAVAGIASQPETYFMGSTGGGVWKTTNAGEDWTNVSDGFFDVASIGAIDVAPSDPNVIYVGTGSACLRGNSSTGRGVYRSTDGGKTWTFVGLPESGVIGRIAVHPEDADVAYVAAVGHPFGQNEQRGVFRTTDGGDSWEKVLYISEKTGAVDLALNPKNPREIYAGLWTAERKPWTMISGSQEGGLYKSSDGGDTWNQLEGGLPTGLVGKTAVTVSPANPDRVWALVEAPEPKAGLYRSDDAGQSWTRVNDHRKLLQRAWYYIHLYADPQDENTVYALNTGFYKSVDGGKTFERGPIPHGDVHDLWLNPNDPSKMVVGNDGGAQVTLDGARSWSTMYNQPTAEIYSVTVDNQVPYRIYGPQQDNSTISLKSWWDSGIHPKQHWKSVGGCETGPIALHPDHPHMIYSGCYGGTLSRVNERTGQERNVMVYPQLQLGQKPTELRERFQWNSPIVVSPHDKDVVYHASHRIWRTEDGGMSWTRLSDDLTTDTPKHQDYAGEPITKDNTGVEVYNTVFSLRVSPHTAQTLWAGTDDGRVWLSEDRGDSWQEITPDAMPEQGTVNRIEVSPHAEGTAYLSVFRYRMDDFTPYVFRTTDYGETWTRIADGTRGIPDDYPVRVVREDPDREGLLYAGTEFGLFVSFDDGAHWQSLQQDLPVTPITDLKVHRQDLIVATQGRGFYVMDDLTPLHQLDRQVASADHHLFEPRTAHLINKRQGGGDRWPEGPQDGAVLHYTLDSAPDSAVTLDIVSSEGEVLRSFTSDSSAAEEAGEPVLPAEAGMNRFAWNLREPAVETTDDAIVWGYTGGVKVTPGMYEARLSVDGETMTQRFQVEKDPRLKNVTPEDLAAQHQLASAIRDTLQQVYDKIRMLRSVRDQLQSVQSYAKQAGYDEAMLARADSITQRLTDVEQALIQTQAQSFQDVLNFPPQFDNQVAYLYGYVAGPNGRPTQGARTRWADVKDQWMEHRSRLMGIIQDDVRSFNATVRDAGAQPVFVPVSTR